MIRRFDCMYLIVITANTKCDSGLQIFLKPICLEKISSGCICPGTHLYRPNCLEPIYPRPVCLWFIFSGTHCREAQLPGTHFSGAFFSWAYLFIAQLPWTNLSGTRWFGAHLSRANLSRSPFALGLICLWRNCSWAISPKTFITVVNQKYNSS